MKARKALLHAKNYFLITQNSESIRVHMGEDPQTLLLTLAIHNQDFYDTIKQVIIQADTFREDQDES